MDKTYSFTIADATSEEWAYDLIKPSFYKRMEENPEGTNLEIFEVSSRFYWDQLEVLPPMYCKGSKENEVNNHHYIVTGFGICEFYTGEYTSVFFELHYNRIGVHREEAVEKHYCAILPWPEHKEILKQFAQFITDKEIPKE